jgi:Ni/Fe-hydrogenase subunit HybB-like protein
VLNLENYITLKHIDNMNRILLATGMMVGYAYVMEFFIAMYSGNEYERYAFLNRAFGPPYGWAYWAMVFCNVAVPQLFWSARLRRMCSSPSSPPSWSISGCGWSASLSSLLRCIGIFLPSSWDYYAPTWVEVSIYIGTLGIFFTLFLLFCQVRSGDCHCGDQGNSPRRTA